jgi:1,4-alpha-glucan branching enzyme
MSETYIPMLDVFERALDDGVDFRISMTLSPTLCEMLSDPMLQARYVRHVSRLLELSEKEVARTRSDATFQPLALMYRDHFVHVIDKFERQCGRNILNAFKRVQDAGKLEIITCAATHGFLPLMLKREAVRAQINVGVENYRKHFGRPPRGIWLPECGFNPGDDAELAKAGIKHFIIDTHGILYGSPRPKHGVYAPVRCKSGVAAFGRDVESSRQVWSAKEGYPGDACYREFYRDVGYDAPYEYIRPYLHTDGVRRNIGIKYYSITGRVELHDKQPYQPKVARDRAAEHAGNFMFNRQQQAVHLNGITGRPPIMVAPYDAELFGHWWFEGPQFIDFFIRKMHHDQGDVALTTPSDYIERFPKMQTQSPTLSSWGNKGYAEMWLNGSNDWIHRHLHVGEERMVELANRFPSADGVKRRALNQAAREFLLAQSSDWPFLMTVGACEPYAQKRFKMHTQRFTRLYGDLMGDKIDERWLSEIEGMDTVFQEIDYRHYASQ